jgi:hypothetical protein
MTETVIFSRRQSEEMVLGEGDAVRSYTLAPLTVLEQQMFKADMASAGAQLIGPWRLRGALRDGLRELAPDNLAELLALLDQAEAAEDAGEAVADDLRRQREIVALSCMQVPHYAALRAAEEFYWGMMPLVILRRALRGWSGPGLPDFSRQRGQVPAVVIDELPQGDIMALGNRAWLLTYLPASAGNDSGAQSPAPETSTPSKAEKRHRTARHG